MHQSVVFYEGWTVFFLCFFECFRSRAYLHFRFFSKDFRPFFQDSSNSVVCFQWVFIVKYDGNYPHHFEGVFFIEKTRIVFSKTSVIQWWRIHRKIRQKLPFMSLRGNFPSKKSMNHRKKRQSSFFSLGGFFLGGCFMYIKHYFLLNPGLWPVFLTFFFASKKCPKLTPGGPGGSGI